MKESIINVLALFGAITVLISIGFLIFMTVVTWKEHVKEEKEHMKLHTDLKGSLLRDAIASTVDILKESDLKMMILREKWLSAICGDSIWLLMMTAFVTELILESEGDVHNE